LNSCNMEIERVVLSVRVGAARTRSGDVTPPLECCSRA
jgi:hypothetical protein